MQFSKLQNSKRKMQKNCFHLKFLNLNLTFLIILTFYIFSADVNKCVDSRHLITDIRKQSQNRRKTWIHRYHNVEDKDNYAWKMNLSYKKILFVLLVCTIYLQGKSF